jgi:hypothetical protein
MRNLASYRRKTESKGENMKLDALTPDSKISGKCKAGLHPQCTKACACGCHAKKKGGNK